MSSKAKEIKSQSKLIVEKMIQEFPTPVCRPITSKKFKRDKYKKNFEDY